VNPITPGFYGKLPAHGDFVSRRLPRAFIKPWDRWLQDLIRHSRSQLGEDWLEYYLQSPFWRFLLGAGLCGDSPVAGVMMPSMDRGGRYFFLTSAALVQAGQLTTLAEHHQAWFLSLEALSRQALDEDLDADQLIARMDGLGVAPTSTTPATPWHHDLADGNDLHDALATLAADRLSRVLLDGSLWWTTGSPRVRAILLHCQEGLPPPPWGQGFLAGRW
jgi:type VI secretion system protein ImpM